MQVSEHAKFDAVIPFHPKDSSVLPYCILGLRQNAKALRNIYIVSAEEPEDLEEATWIPEAAFPFSKEDVGSIIRSTNGREGWYYQQLVKLYVFRQIPDILPHVLLFDSDLVMCRPIEFICPEGKALFSWSPPQGHKAYFTHAKTVLHDQFIHVHPDKCGITDHMLVYRPILEEMLQKIEAIHGGTPAWRVLLEAVAPGDWNYSGMSEYEIYFNYALTWHSEKYSLRHLEFSSARTFEALTKSSGNTDIIAFHEWNREAKYRDNIYKEEY